MDDAVEGRRRDLPGRLIAILLLLLNIFAPTTTDVRVVNYIVPIVSQVRGRVIEVPGREQPAGEEGGRAVPDRPDALSERGGLARGAAGVRGGARRRRTRKLAEVQARLADAQTSERQLNEQLKEATGPGVACRPRWRSRRSASRRTPSW